jgi:hypothetical protein
MSEECVFCSTDMKAGDAIMTASPCGHVSHNGCWAGWSQRCRENQRVVACPLCPPAGPGRTAPVHMSTTRAVAQARIPDPASSDSDESEVDYAGTVASSMMHPVAYRMYQHLERLQPCHRSLDRTADLREATRLTNVLLADLEAYGTKLERGEV